MSAVTKLRHASAPRVALATDDPTRARDLAAILERRGITTQEIDIDAGIGQVTAVTGYAPTEVPAVERAAELAADCASAARAGRPVVILAAFEAPAANRAVEHHAALACLRSHGAILCRDVDVFVETLVLTATAGLPPGRRMAIVARDGSLLSAAIQGEVRRVEQLGARHRSHIASADDGVDAVLVDAEEVGSNTPAESAGAMVVVLAARSELVPKDLEQPCLVGVGPAMNAVVLAGELAERIKQGLGPAESDDVDALSPDRERFARQLRRLGDRAGDHEAKVLLAAYGIEVTRQAVATTPSAAARIAKRAGWPVELKPWGPDCPTELAGCPVETNLETAADVRRAFAAVGALAGLPAGSPVIVRASPPRGREMRVRVKHVVAVGPTVVVEVDGAMDAAPAPLSRTDARLLAAPLCASRSSDRQLDRDTIADVLVRISHMVVENRDVVESLDAARVIASFEDDLVVVADAQILLSRQ